MRVELVRPTQPDTEWRIAVNGQAVVAFAGPEAENRAQACYRELNDRLASPIIGRGGDTEQLRDPPGGH